MVLIHTVGDTGDFISVTLIGGNHVQFEYESGKGPQGVTVETAYRYTKHIIYRVNKRFYRVILLGYIESPTLNTCTYRLDHTYFFFSSQLNKLSEH